MIYGIGIDIVEIDRMERAIDRWGGRFLDRVFCPEEQERCLKVLRPAAGFAARFAAKEAFVKALRTGFRHGMGPSQICVRQDGDGAPYIEIGGEVARWAARAGLKKWHLSISHEKAHAVAVVVLEV